MDTRLKDLSIGRAVKGQSKPLASRSPVMECRSSFDIEQVVGDSAVQHNLQRQYTSCIDLSKSMQHTASKISQMHSATSFHFSVIHLVKHDRRQPKGTAAE